MDLRKIKKLIDLLEESNLAEIEIKEGEESVRLARVPKGGLIAAAPAPVMHHVAPAAGEPVVVKHFANAFRETRLAALLKDLGAKTLVIAGMQTHMCVEAGARAGADLGFDIVIVDDACATRDLTFRETTVPAASVHAAVLAALNGSYAKILTSAGLLAALKPN